MPEVVTCMQTAQSAQGWQELLSSLVGTARDITSLLLGALQSQQGPEAEQQGERVPARSHFHLYYCYLGLSCELQQSSTLPGATFLKAQMKLPFAVAAPSFADMGNAIGSLIMLGKGQREEEEDSVLLSEEHSLILTCCWVSVKVGASPHGTAQLLGIYPHW